MTTDSQNGRVGIIGVGSMGKGLLYQSTITPGVNCVAISDTLIDRCVEAAEEFKLDYAIAASENEFIDIIGKGRLAICENGLWLSRCGSLNLIIEATSAIGSAGVHAMTALEEGKHVILMNSEIDLIFGPLLAHTAARNNVVCTSCDGDQYGVLKHLIDDIKRWGFNLVMAGNIKGFLDRYATPDSIVAEADKRNLDYHMCTSYTDGTKLNIEMAIIANACGLSTKVPGMYGHKAQHVGEVFELFDFDSLWADRMPFVDYILGAEPGGGVFVVGYCDNPYQQSMLSYYKMGDGPYYLFYRPYHLCHIEAMGTVLEVLQGRPRVLQPIFGFQTNVIAYSKADLSPGTRLDGIGGRTCYGIIENSSDDKPSGLPICLAEGIVVRNFVEKDKRICLDDIFHDSARTDFSMFAKSREYAATGR